MAFPRVIPALADLTQDIAGPVPVELLQNWATGTQDLQTAEGLLQSFQITGHVVSTDSSGLSRLTGEQDLLDVLARVSEPKEIVFALGTEIGGRAIGVWVADNSEMFYPASVATERVLDAMNEARQRIARSATIAIGMCIHSGSFYEIGGGLYGVNARIVESAAEHYAGPGEILVTEAVRSELRDRNGYSFVPRVDLQKTYPDGIFAVETNRGLPGLAGSLKWYPHPFTIEFYGLFARLRNPEETAAVKRRIYAEYGRECAVLFVSREPAAEASDSLRSLLDDLLINALVDTILKQTMHALEYLSSSGGGIAILTFERVEEALAFAHELQTRFAENGVAIRMALDFGPVLAFRDGEGRGIAGDPVNLASKLAEDLGEPGRIRITERAARRFPATPAGDSFEVTISGVYLKGISLQN